MIATAAEGEKGELSPSSDGAEDWEGARMGEVAVEPMKR